MVQVVLCNCSPEEARPLARRLVEEDLAACVNVIPQITSIYRWKGELCDDQESTLLIKTTQERYPALADALERHHSYDVPEIIAIDTAEVSDAYAEWVHEQIR